MCKWAISLDEHQLPEKVCWRTHIVISSESAKFTELYKVCLQTVDNGHLDVYDISGIISRHLYDVSSSMFIPENLKESIFRDAIYKILEDRMA